MKLYTQLLDERDHDLLVAPFFECIPPPPPCISYALESVGLSVGTCRWTFHRSWISYALVQATVGVGTVLIWYLI